MKKVLIASAISLATMGLPAGMAMAASNSTTCGHISFTGNNSVNTITCDQHQNVNIICDNNVDVVDVNGQSGSSGNATVTYNSGNGSYSYSGNVVNTNNGNSTVDVSCVAPASQPITPTPPSGGQGGGQVLGQSTTKAAVLPNTGASMVNGVVIAAVALVASGLAIATGLVPAAFRKVFNK